VIKHGWGNVTRLKLIATGAELCAMQKQQNCNSDLPMNNFHEVLFNFTQSLEILGKLFLKRYFFTALFRWVVML